MVDLRASRRPDIDKFKDLISLIDRIEAFSRLHEVLIAKFDSIVSKKCISKKRQKVWIDEIRNVVTKKHRLLNQVKRLGTSESRIEYRT